MLVRLARDAERAARRLEDDVRRRRDRYKMAELLPLGCYGSSAGDEPEGGPMYLRPAMSYEHRVVVIGPRFEEAEAEQAEAAVTKPTSPSFSEDSRSRRSPCPCGPSTA